MKLFDYDKTSRESILKYALNIYKKSFNQLYYEHKFTLPEENHKNTNKGALGEIIEKHLFNLPKNNKKEADFKEAELELKVTPVKELKDGSITSKERLSLSMIDYNEIINETWDNNSLFKKIKYILLMFYLYEEEKEVEDYIFELIKIWSPSKADLLRIEKDWNIIKEKINRGEAHKLSEGDTMYLAASTKGGAKTKPREQPNNIIKAKPRGFSFKPKYMKQVYKELTAKKEVIKISEDRDFEDVIINKFKPLIGKDLEYIFKKYPIISKRKAKHFLYLLSNDLFKEFFGEKSEELDEFQKAGLKLKSVLLGHDDTIKEKISSKNIDYIQMANENWETSEIKWQFENLKYLFFVFKTEKKYDNQRDLELKDIKLNKIKFWNMPFDDLEGDYKELWLDTHEKIINDRYYEFLGLKGGNRVGHIRPKGRNGDDMTYNTPQGTEAPKRCFWLNSDYIAEQIKD